MEISLEIKLFIYHDSVSNEDVSGNAIFRYKTGEKKMEILLFIVSAIGSLLSLYIFVTTDRSWGV